MESQYGNYFPVYVIIAGNFDFNHKTFGNVLKDAEELKFDGVVKYCHDFLNQSLDCSNCISILLCSKSSQQTDVYEASFEFIEVSHARKLNDFGSMDSSMN